jgi:TetR/AcrR family transcriptional regulator, cholesterol catabolism regulator
LTVPSAAASAPRPRGRPRKAPEALDEGNRRQKLLRVAARLFRRDGFAATTTRDIAAAAGMRSGSPFYHFESKAALLYAVVEQGMRAALQRQARSLEAAAQAAPEAVLRKLIRTHYDILLGPGSDFIPVMLYEWRSLESAQRAAIARLQRDYESAWADTMAALHLSGAIRADARVARLMVLGALNWSVQWYKQARGATLDELTEIAMQLFVPERAGAATPRRPR